MCLDKGRHWLMYTMSPILALFSSSCTANFLLLLTSFLYLG